jgi:hypothetical protein
MLDLCSEQISCVSYEVKLSVMLDAVYEVCQSCININTLKTMINPNGG